MNFGFITNNSTYKRHDLQRKVLKEKVGVAENETLFINAVSLSAAEVKYSGRPELKYSITTKDYYPVKILNQKK